MTKLIDKKTKSKDDELKGNAHFPCSTISDFWPVPWKTQTSIYKHFCQKMY